jgi:superoxide dismutase
MPGVGWAITFRTLQRLALQPLDHPPRDQQRAGFRPVVVMDAWEHAFVPDYKPYERAKYVEAYFSNIDWERPRPTQVATGRSRASFASSRPRTSGHSAARIE